jgi:hypothetical protein
MGRLDYYASAWLPARQIVLDSVTAREQVSANGRILILEQFVPWKVRATRRTRYVL